MKLLSAAAVFLLAFPLFAQNTATTAAAVDPFRSLSFLEGTWEAKTQGDAAASSNYTFSPELKNHVLGRHGDAYTNCKGPAQFDCEHNDLFYVYVEGPGQRLRAIYFDNEGHVIHYDVTTPAPTTVVFLSDASQPGPQFRLTYELKGATMSGKFQMHMPGQADWKSYLEWSGGKK